MTQSPKPRAVAYVRVSKEREGMVSPELQEFEIRTFAARQGIEIVRVIADLDMSGRGFGKRSVQRIIEGITADEWSHVLLWKWSRWGRNLLESRIYLAAAEEAGGTVRAATEDMDTSTAVGKFTRDQMLAIAELQSNQISEGWRETHARRRRLGLPHNGRPRYGYTYDRGKGYTPDPVTGPLVADAYRRFVEGESLRSIAFDWTGRGMRTTTGKPWERTSLRRMLDTGFAAGLIREKSKPDTASHSTIGAFDVWRDGAHGALISPDLWERYRARRAINSEKAARHVSVTHALSGLLSCSICGATLVAAYSGTNNRHFWRCPRVIEARAHEAITVQNAHAEQEVFDWIKEHAQGGDDLSEKRARLKAARVAVSDVTTLEAEVVRLTAKRRRAADAYTDGLIEREDFESQKAEIVEGLAAAERGLARAREEAQNVAQATPETFTGLEAAWERLSPQVRNEALSKVVARIHVSPGRGPGRVRVVAKWDQAATG